MHIEKAEELQISAYFIDILLQYFMVSSIFIKVAKTTITINDTIYVVEKNVFEKCSNLLCYFK